jgi:nucleoside-diphosphate-sugar epimerase
MKKTAIIAGASGLVGRVIIKQLRRSNQWHIIGLGRQPHTMDVDEWVSVDLTDLKDCEKKLSTLKAVTHIFYAGRYDHPEGIPESVQINTAMMVNLINTLDQVARLEHVHAVHGSKYYGHQLGPVTIPMVEDQSRAPNQNFYFNQEDFLIERTRHVKWSYSTSRPHAFCDPEIDRPRSIGLVIAVYAIIQKALGLPLHFPGSEKGFHTLTQFTDLGLLARSIEWMATDKGCANQCFNVVNGDTPRWSQLWPSFAQYFDMPLGEAKNIRLVDWVKDKDRAWESVLKKNNLLTTRAQNVALWAYGDYQFRPEWDVTSSMQKAQQLGFSETIDSFAMFKNQFDNYRFQHLIP